METIKHVLIPDIIQKKIDNPWKWVGIFLAGVNVIVLLSIIFMNRTEGSHVYIVLMCNISLI